MMRFTLLISLVLVSLSSFAQSVDFDKRPATKMTPVATLSDHQPAQIEKPTLLQEKLIPVSLSQTKLDARNQDQALLERKQKGPSQVGKLIATD